MGPFRRLMAVLLAGILAKFFTFQAVATGTIAGANGASASQSSPSTVGSPTTSTQGGSTVTGAPSQGATSPVRAPSPSGGGNMNQGARTAQASQALGAVGNGMTGAMMIVTANAVRETNPTLAYIMYGMAALSFAQAAATMASARGSKAVGDATDPYRLPGFNFDAASAAAEFPPTGDPVLDKLYGDYQNLKVDQNLKRLAGAGITVDPNTGKVTTPIGALDSGALSSPASMGSLGLNAAEIEKMSAVIDDINKRVENKYKAIAMGLEGGGGGSSAYTPSKYDSGLNLNFPNPFAQSGSGRSPASVAGMHRLAGGEPIGVKGDDIFQMIHRAYQAKRKANYFIESAEDPSITKTNGSGR